MSKRKGPKPLHIVAEARFDCRRCGACCRGPRGQVITPDEHAHLRGFDWEDDGDRFASGPIARHDNQGILRLEAPGGQCIFLDTDNACLVHKRLGFEHKPLRCQLFPYRITELANERRVVISPECASWHESFETGPLPTLDQNLERVAATAPAMQPAGGDVLWFCVGDETVALADAVELLDELAGIVGGDNPLAQLPWRIRQEVVKWLPRGPERPWLVDGPPEAAFYRVLETIGSPMAVLAQQGGFGLLATAFAELRTWQSVAIAGARLSPEAEAFVRNCLRQWLFELRPLVFGRTLAGIGTCLYLTLAIARGAERLAARKAPQTMATAGNANHTAREAALFLRWSAAPHALANHGLGCERLVLDAHQERT